jgi:hypothetical protein
VRTRTSFQVPPVSMKTLRSGLVASVLLLAAAGAQAQFPGDIPDTFHLKLGGMYAWFNTDVTFQENLTPGGPIGAGISLEDTLGMPSSKPGFVARGDWNVVGRLFVDFGYSGFERSATHTIARDFNFGDSTYTLGASVSTRTKSDLPYFDFRYGIIKNESTQFGLSLGAAYAFLEASASASAGVIGPNGPIVGQTVTRTAKISVPVPLLGLQFDQKLGDGFAAGVLFDGLFAPVHPYVGSVFDAEAHLDWYATRNFGVSVAFNYTKFNLKKEETNTFVDFSYSYYGPRLYLTLNF